MHVILISIHEIVEGLSLEGAVCLGHWHNPNPVSLREDTLSRETNSVRLDQLSRCIVDCCIWEPSHWEYLGGGRRGGREGEGREGREGEWLISRISWAVSVM